MSIGDNKSVVKIQKIDQVQINEALRQLSTTITKLEGRDGAIQLRDGIHSTTSTQSGLVLDSEISNLSSFGIYYTGVDGSDCWLASGARLKAPNEWIAINTRAAFVKLSASGGPNFYYNTGLTIGASFIPTIVVAPGSAALFVWATYDSTTSGSPIVWDQTLHEEAGYFTLQGGGTQVEILTEGTHQINVSALMDTTGAFSQARVKLLLNGSPIRETFQDSVSLDAIQLHTMYHIDNFVAGDLLSVSFEIADLYVAEASGNRFYITKLISA